MLEQDIARLQSRLQELEQDDPTLVRLHDPYIQAQSSGSQSVVQPAPQPNWWEMPEPPDRIAKILSVASSFSLL